MRKLKFVKIFLILLVYAGKKRLSEEAKALGTTIQNDLNDLLLGKE